MDNTNDSNNYKHIISIAIQTRGLIINEAIWLENVIEGILTEYFCPDNNRALEFTELFLRHNKSTLLSKVQALDYLINKHHPAFNKKYPSFFKALNEIIKERNVVAHDILDTSLESIGKYDGEITFFQSTSQRKPTKYSQARLDHIYTLIKNTTYILILNFGGDYSIASPSQK